VNRTDPTGEQICRSCSGGSAAGPAATFAGQSTSGRASWDSANRITNEERLETISEAASRPSDAFGSYKSWRKADLSARRLEGASVVAVGAPGLALTATTSGPVVGGILFGGSLAFEMEASMQAVSGNFDGKALAFETLKGAALGGMGSKVISASKLYSNSNAGGVALGMTINAIVLPQASGVLSGGFASLHGRNPERAYGNAALGVL